MDISYHLIHNKNALSRKFEGNKTGSRLPVFSGHTYAQRQACLPNTNTSVSLTYIVFRRTLPVAKKLIPVQTAVNPHAAQKATLRQQSAFHSVGQLDNNSGFFFMDAARENGRDGINPIKNPPLSGQHQDISRPLFITCPVPSSTLADPSQRTSQLEATSHLAQHLSAPRSLSRTCIQSRHAACYRRLSPPLPRSKGVPGRRLKNMDDSRFNHRTC